MRHDPQQHKPPGTFQVLGDIIRAWGKLATEVTLVRQQELAELDDAHAKKIEEILDQDAKKKEIRRHNEERQKARCELIENFNRLQDTDTMLAFGYVVRHLEKCGQSIPQASIVNILFEAQEMRHGDQPTDDLPPFLESLKKTRDSIRMDLSRRYKTLAYFGLVQRNQVTRVHVEMELTEAGRKANSQLNLASERRVL